MDSYYRNGELIDHKVKADEAIAAAQKEGFEIDKVLVWRRHAGEYGSQSPMIDGRDFFVDVADARIQRQAGRARFDAGRGAAVPDVYERHDRPAEGRPADRRLPVLRRGNVQVLTQDIHPGDIYWCFADIGWITGHSYIVYGPLALGTTSVMYEGVPTYPDPGRPWRIAEKLGVNIFHTAPTTIRMLRKLGPDEPAKYDYHFTHLTTVGEPIEPDVWRCVSRGSQGGVLGWW